MKHSWNIDLIKIIIFLRGYKLTTYFFLESVTVLADTISNVTRCEDFLGDNWVGIWVPDILDHEPIERIKIKC